MTQRNMTADQLAANGLQSAKFYELLYVRTRQTGSATYDHTYITNAAFDITVDTNVGTMGLGLGTQTFLALGPFLQFSSVEETADFQISNVTVSLGGLRGQDISLFLDNQYIDQPIKIFRAWYDNNGAIIGDPVMIFDGRIDKPVVSDSQSEGTIVACQASSQWVDYNRRAGRHTNPSEQRFIDKKIYGSAEADLDTGFKYATNAVRDLKWGGS